MAAIRASYRELGYALKIYASGPKTLGKLIYENPNAPPSRYTGLHGTQLEKIEGQLDVGVFDPREKPVYVYRPFPWNAARAAMWAKNRPEAVVVEVGSSAPSLTNRCFNTQFFDNPEEAPLVIHRVWKVSDIWRSYAWHSNS
ncbi:hypothetical protein K0U07_01360 [bacterium]|nr:hypothetical protein [bacterium]